MDFKALLEQLEILCSNDDCSSNRNLELLKDDFAEYLENTFRYTLHAYRENGADYCRGCLMGSSHSDYKVISKNTKEELINEFAKLIHFNNTSGLEYAAYEFTLYEYGQDLTYSEDYDDILSEATNIAKDSEAYEKKLQEEKEMIRLAEARKRKEAAEKEELARLIKQYGLPT